ncbi:ESF1 protein, partial [Polypterus senegalus]
MASKQNMKKDERFSHVMKDPRFWEMPEKERKVKIDKRFQSMFYDKKFKLKYTVDKRGRPISHTSTDDLKRFYALSDSDISEQEDKEQDEKKKKKKVRSKAKQGSKEEKALSLSGDDGRKCKVTKKNQLSVIESKSSKLTKQAKGEKAKAEKTHKGMKASSKDQHEDTMHDKKAAPADVLPVAGIDIKSSAEEDTESETEADEDDESTVGTSSTDEEGSSVEENDSLEAETAEDEIDEEEDSDSGEESDFGPDLARGMGNIETSSDEDEENDMTELLHAEEEIEHDWGELWKDAPRGEDVTRRLALCNIDWERLKAKDLLAVFNSFKPKGGIVYSVKIYPSDFGKERIKKEEQQGPLELVTLPEDPEEDNEAQREKMREYQFKRMRYYYAVVDCDSPETASKIYEECDGYEYESSCSVMDLRFIPDDVTFDDEPKDVAADVDLAAYTPKYFSSSATATSKVELTWDETDHDRVTLFNRKFKKDEILSMDFNAYLASSSEEDECVDDDSVDDKETQVEKMDGAEMVQNKKLDKTKKDDEEQISKYRELLKSIQNKEKTHKDIDMEMQIKWVPGLKETTEKLVKQKLEGKEKLTPWEEFLKKKKEKKLQKKKQGKNKVSPEEQISDDELPPDVDLNDPYFAEEIGQLEMTLLMMDDEDESRKHFNYDKIVEQQNLSKQKRKKLMKQEELLEEDTFQVDVSDPRFNAIYTSHLYNLDPADPAYKKTRGTEKIIEEKLKRREHRHQSQEGMATNKRQLSEEEEKSKGTVPVHTKLEPGLSMLIKSIKSKTEQFQARKKQKTSTS